MGVATTRRSVAGSDLGRQLCAALGLDPMEVAAITVLCEPGEPARIRLDRLVFDAEAERLRHVLATYALVDQERVS